MAKGDGGGDNINNHRVEHAETSLKPSDYVAPTVALGDGQSGLNLARQTDAIHAQNAKGYDNLSLDDTSAALKINEANIKATQERIYAIMQATNQHKGRDTAASVYGDIQIT